MYNSSRALFPQGDCTAQKPRAAIARAALPMVLLGALAACQPSTAPGPAAGEPKAAATTALQAGARVLQPMGPAGKLDIHLVGFHPMKDAPQQQMEAHHYCHQLNEDLAQCALFDSDAEDARLVGIEYIISERLFAQLPPQEHALWHPHNGEILSGQLSAPNLPQPAEHALMERKMNSYGKTWHVWHPSDAALPLGEPQLAWSFNREGEVDPQLLARRDAATTTSTAERREHRRDLLPLARPQEGVDALRDAFPQATPWEGVQQAKAEKNEGAGTTPRGNR